jgi:hypothetical protein
MTTIGIARTLAQSRAGMVAAVLRSTRVRGRQTSTMTRRTRIAGTVVTSSDLGTGGKNDTVHPDPASDALVRASRNYEPIALVRGPEGVLVIVRVGMRNSKRFMVLNEAAQPAWNHESLSSLSDVAWALVAHHWHTGAVEGTGTSHSVAKRLARLLKERG